MKFAVVGAGFTGAVLAREFADAGIDVSVFETRDHVGGNCYTEREKRTGILVHKYGPHIFHTDNSEIWSYVNRYSKFIPYTNRVKTTYRDKVYSLPINLHTINQFFEKCLNPTQAREFIKGKSKTEIVDPKNFEEQALAFIGEELYRAFFEGYTKKQWGMSPSELPASILKRLPVRFNYDDNYFNHQHQGMPENGYTPIFELLLDHPRIQTHLSTTFEKRRVEEFDWTFYSGPLDAWFDFSIGHLGYRTLDFVMEIHAGDYQGCAVMNYADVDTPYTRITEHKHFSPWADNSQTVIFKEYSRECRPGDIPYYPIRLVEEKKLLHDYVELAKRQEKVSFLGRLGTYRYLDMDVTISEALLASKNVLDSVGAGENIPAFFNSET